MVSSSVTMNEPAAMGKMGTPLEPMAKPISPRGPGGILISISSTLRAGMLIGDWKLADFKVPAGIRTANE